MEQPSGAETPGTGAPEVRAPEATTSGATTSGASGTGAAESEVSGLGPSDSTRVRRVVGAVALGVGAVLAVVGSTLPLFEQVLTFTAARETFTMTLWGFESSSGIRIGDVGVRYGVPVIFAAALLAVSAALVLAAPRLPVRLAGPTSVAAIGAAAVLTGSVWTVGQVVLVAVSNEDVDDVRTAVGSGLTTLVLACLVALAGGLLVQHRPDQVPATRRPEPRGVVVYRLPDAEADADTPPLGIPAAEDTGGGS